MTLELKRILIAEACGYEERGGGPEGIYYTRDDRDGEFLFKELPDYFNDLNAMYEAEKVLTDMQYSLYCGLLDEAGYDDRGLGYPNRSRSATAAQRAEAFGRALGLWT